MASLAALYREAKDAGFSPKEIRGMNADEVTELLNSKSSKPQKASKKGKATKPVAKKKTGAKRGRPKGSKNSPKAVSKKTATVESDMTEKQAKRIVKKYEGKRGRRPAEYHEAMSVLGNEPETVSKAKPKAKKSATKNVNGNGGRHLLDGIDWSKTEGWNPREGSPPDRIIKALKKNKGDREKVFENLKSDIWDFMGKQKRNGEKRTKAEAEEMLRYRISRTAWQFGLQTGQHEVASDRAEYGTAGTGQGTFKRGKSSGAAKKSTGKRGRPAKAQKASKASAPNGSVNPKDMSDKALRKYIKSFEGKRGTASR